MALHNDLGLWGELVVADYLKNNNYFVVCRNWKYKHKDIDIIAIDNNTKELVFVEVKTRSHNLFLEPEQSVNVEKIKNLKSIANSYIHFRNIQREHRFDIVTVLGTDDTNFTINHIKDAFY